MGDVVEFSLSIMSEKVDWLGRKMSEVCLDYFG